MAATAMQGAGTNKPTMGQLCQLTKAMLNAGRNQVEEKRRIERKLKAVLSKTQICLSGLCEAISNGNRKSETVKFSAPSKPEWFV